MKQKKACETGCFQFRKLKFMIIYDMMLPYLNTKATEHSITITESICIPRRFIKGVKKTSTLFEFNNEPIHGFPRGEMPEMDAFLLQRGEEALRPRVVSRHAYPREAFGYAVLY